MDIAQRRQQLLGEREQAFIERDKIFAVLNRIEGALMMLDELEMDNGEEEKAPEKATD